MSSLDDVGKLVRCQDHLLSVIRLVEPLNEKVVEEACLGFILPTVRAYLVHHRIRYFRTLNTVAQFLNKLQFKDSNTASADLNSFRRFQECALGLDVSLAKRISELLPECKSFRHKSWKFGPGASYEVSRRSGADKKFRILREHPCNYTTYRLLSKLGYKHWTCPSFDVAASRAIAVPKSVKKRRIITVEPTYHTLATQALREVLLGYIKQTGFNIFIDDQSYNRALALMGSANGQLATIDMSAASDSVTLRLVRILFQRTGLQPYLEDARVSQCIIEGEKVTLQSWAGMGNACTFPLECLVFAAVVEYVAKEEGSPHGKLYAIVGDDIVVHRSLFEPVCAALTKLGFCINTDKTFGSDFPFRESCGIEALSGHNVTPVRISRQAYFNYSNTAVESAIAVSNNLYDYGYSYASSAIRQWFRLKERGIPYTDDPDGYGMLIWQKPDNRHLKSRYSPEYQCYQLRVRDFSARRTNGSDDSRYQCWLMTRWQPEDKISENEPRYGLPDISEQVRVGPPIAMPRWRYMVIQP